MDNTGSKRIRDPFLRRVYIWIPGKLRKANGGTDLTDKRGELFRFIGIFFSKYRLRARGYLE